MNFPDAEGNIQQHPSQQADGYIENDDELVEEIADTATIEELLDDFIQEVSEMHADLLETSLQGNSVKTHLQIQSFGQDLWEMAYTLRDELVVKLANRAEQFEEQGETLRTQVVDKQEG